MDAGGSLFGSEVADRTQGRSSVALMNALGYDAAALGEGDFSFGLEVLRQRMAEAAFPFLSANVVSLETGQLLAEPYIIKQVGGHKVGIIGLTSPRAGGQLRYLREPPKERITVRDPIETAQGVVDRLRPEADVIIILSNLGEYMDEQLAKAVPGIDVIVGGRDGRIYYPPRKIPETDVLRVTASQRGESLGALRVMLAGQGMRETGDSALIVLGPDVPDDPDLKALVERWKAGGLHLTPSAPRSGTETAITPAHPTSAPDSGSEPPTLVIEGPEGTISPGAVTLSWAPDDAAGPADRFIYRFRLTGRSEREGWPPGTWSPWVTIREVTLHFPRGEYTFTVQAQDEDGDATEAQWTFKVE